MNSNGTTDFARNRFGVVQAVVVVVVGLGVSEFFGEVHPRIQFASLIVAGLIVLTTVRSLAITLVIVLAAFEGGWLALVAASVVVLFAAHCQSHYGGPIGRKGWARSIVLAVVVFLLSYLIQREASSGGSVVNQGSDGAGGSGDWVSAATDPGINWWLVLGLALLTVVAIALAIYVWKRRRTVAELPMTSALSLQRLERIGASVGRHREPHEGVLTYAEALAGRTGDERFRTIGSLISTQIFHGSADIDRLEFTLGQLEAEPPEKLHQKQYSHEY